MAHAASTPSSEPRIGPHPSYIEVAKPYVLQSTIDRHLTILGIAESKEVHLRLQGVSWIDSVRRALHLPIRTFNTAVVYYHKFRLLHPDQDYNWADAAAAALFTACKIEDTLKKSRDILCANYNLKVTSGGAGSELASPDDARFEQHAKLIIGLERLMLESAGFDFRNRYPQKLVVKMARAVGFEKEREGKTAWDLSVDLYRTWAPVKQTTTTLAVACVELAGRLHDWKGEKGLVDAGVLDYEKWCTTRAEVMETMLDLLDLYMYHQHQTLVGPLYALDKFTHVKISLNKEATDNNIPRYTQYSSSLEVSQSTNGSSIKLSKPRNGINPTSPLTPATPQGTISPSQGAPTSAIGIRGQSGTVRFMLDAARARDEKKAVDKFWVVEEEEYTEEVPVVEPERRREDAASSASRSFGLGLEAGELGRGRSQRARSAASDSVQPTPSRSHASARMDGVDDWLSPGCNRRERQGPLFRTSEVEETQSPRRHPDFRHFYDSKRLTNSPSSERQPGMDQDGSNATSLSKELRKRKKGGSDVFHTIEHNEDAPEDENPNLEPLGKKKRLAKSISNVRGLSIERQGTARLAPFNQNGRATNESSTDVDNTVGADGNAQFLGNPNLQPLGKTSAVSGDRWKGRHANVEPRYDGSERIYGRLHDGDDDDGDGDDKWLTKDRGPPTPRLTPFIVDKRISHESRIKSAPDIQENPNLAPLGHRRQRSVAPAFAHESKATYTTRHIQFPHVRSPGTETFHKPDFEARTGRPKCTYDACLKWGHWEETCFIKREHEKQARDASHEPPRSKKYEVKTLDRPRLQDHRERWGSKDGAVAGIQMRGGGDELSIKGRGELKAGKDVKQAREDFRNGPRKRIRDIEDAIDTHYHEQRVHTTKKHLTSTPVQRVDHRQHRPISSRSSHQSPERRTKDRHSSPQKNPTPHREANRRGGMRPTRANDKAHRDDAPPAQGEFLGKYRIYRD